MKDVLRLAFIAILAFVVTAIVFFTGCGKKCPKPPERPAQVVTIYVGCLGDPRLPARPTLEDAVLNSFSACGADVVCSPAIAVNALAEYLEAIAYYHSQLDALCRKELSDEEDQLVDADAGAGAAVHARDAGAGQ